MIKCFVILFVSKPRYLISKINFEYVSKLIQIKYIFNNIKRMYTLMEKIRVFYQVQNDLVIHQYMHCINHKRTFMFLLLLFFIKHYYMINLTTNSHARSALL